MKIVLIGGGMISNAFRSAVPTGVTIKCYGIREFSSNRDLWSDIAEHCEQADIVVYLAYHHNDIYINLYLLRKLLKNLAIRRWQGSFIFFNTQVALKDKIFVGDDRSRLLDLFVFDLYSTTKILQSKILEKYSGNLNIIELYLPIVTGNGANSDRYFEYVSRHEIISLPNYGKNIFAFLDINVFVKRLWQILGDGSLCAQGDRVVNKIFMYQGLKSFSDAILDFRSIAKPPDLSKSEPPYSLVVGNCSYRYRFSDAIHVNAMWYLKGTLIWLLLGKVYRCFKKSNPKLDASIPSTSPSKIPRRFIPIGREYQGFNMSIDLDLIPFAKRRVDP